MSQNINPAEELKIIEEKREALEKAIRVALAIERLQNGIEAAMHMGNETVDIDPKAQQLVDELNPDTKALSNNKLKESLANLEAVVRTRLKHILQISTMDEYELVSAAQGRVEQLVTEYQKKAQTALAIRILLGSRGEPTHPLQTDVAPSELRERVNALSAKEKVYRQAIKTELTSMIEDTVRLLARTDLPEKMRAMMETSKLDFEDNIIHLNTGKSITTLPVAIEIIEMSDDQISNVNTQANTNSTAPDVEKRTVRSAPEPPPLRSAKEQLEELKQKQGFFSQLWHWVTTPSNVKWKDLKYKDRTDK